MSEGGKSGKSAGGSDLANALLRIEANGTQILAGFQAFAESNAAMVRELVDVILASNEVRATAGGSSARSNRCHVQLANELMKRIPKYAYSISEPDGFRRWIERYEHVFIEEGSELLERERTTLLLNSLEENTFFRFKDSQRDVPDIYALSFVDAVAALKAIFSPHRSLMLLRHECLLLSRSSANTSDPLAFVNQLNQMIMDAQLSTMSLDEWGVFLLLRALDGPSDGAVRTYLMQVCEERERKNEKTSISQMYDAWMRFMQLKQTAKSITATAQQHQMYTVAQIDSHEPNVTSSRDKDEKNVGRHKSHATQACARCNRMGHATEDCYAKTIWRPRQVQNIMVDSVSVYPMKMTKIHVPVFVNGKRVKFQLDTGSQITLISRNSWKHLGSPTLDKVPIRISCANGTLLRILGRTRVRFVLKGVEYSGDAHVRERGANLIGMDWLCRSPQMRDSIDELVYDVTCKELERLPQKSVIQPNTHTTLFAPAPTDCPVRNGSLVAKDNSSIEYPRDEDDKFICSLLNDDDKFFASSGAKVVDKFTSKMLPSDDSAKEHPQANDKFIAKSDSTDDKFIVSMVSKEDGKIISSTKMDSSGDKFTVKMVSNNHSMNEVYDKFITGPANGQNDDKFIVGFSKNDNDDKFIKSLSKSDSGIQSLIRRSDSDLHSATDTELATVIQMGSEYLWKQYPRRHTENKWTRLKDRLKVHKGNLLIDNRVVISKSLQSSVHQLIRVLHPGVDRMKPSPQSQSQNKRCAARKKSFQVDQLVYAKMYHGPKVIWESGVIRKKSGRFMYDVQVGSRSVRCHTKRLRARIEKLSRKEVFHEDASSPECQSGNNPSHPSHTKFKSSSPAGVHGEIYNPIQVTGSSNNVLESLLTVDGGVSEVGDSFRGSERREDRPGAKRKQCPSPKSNSQMCKGKESATTPPQSGNSKYDSMAPTLLRSPGAASSQTSSLTSHSPSLCHSLRRSHRNRKRGSNPTTDQASTRSTHRNAPCPGIFGRLLTKEGEVLGTCWTGPVALT